MIKLVVADLDGTLVHNKKISDSTRKIIQQLNDKEIMFTIATGRHVAASDIIAKEFNVKLPIICGNGAYIGYPESKESIYVNSFDRFLVEKILRLCDERELDYVLYTKDTIYGTIVSNYKLQDRIGDIPVTVIKREQMMSHLNEQVIKVLIIEYNIKKFKDIQKTLSEVDGINIASSNIGFLDVGKSDSTKGNALSFLCEHLNIDISEVLAVGDQENDISMIEQAGIGVAMGNGVDSLKEKADYITKTCEDDGFSYAVEKYVFKK